MLVEETARNVKILNAISALEANQIESISYPYRPHRSHLSTRFGLLCYNDKVITPGAMRTTVVTMLHHGHAKWTRKRRPSGGQECSAKYKRNPKVAPAAELQVRTLKRKYQVRKKNRLELLTEPNQELQLDFAGPIKTRTRGDVYILVAVDRFSEWPTAQIRTNTDTRTVIKF